MVSAVAVDDILCTENVQSRAIGYKNGAFYKDDDDVTWYEIAAVLKHPFSAAKLKKQRDISYDLTKNIMMRIKVWIIKRMRSDIQYGIL